MSYLNSKEQVMTYETFCAADPQSIYEHLMTKGEQGDPTMTLISFRATNVIFDGITHIFDQGTPREHECERAIIQGVASYRKEDGSVVTKPRQLIVTRARGEQEVLAIGRATLHSLLSEESEGTSNA